MKHSSRRDFLRTTSALMGTAFIKMPFDFIKEKPLLSFSTLGCPKWTFTNVLDFAVKNNYDGVEIRGILGQLDLPKCPEFSSPEKIISTRKLIEEKKLKIV